jgi:hypothetical protein
MPPIRDRRFCIRSNCGAGRQYWWTIRRIAGQMSESPKVAQLLDWALVGQTQFQYPARI